MRNRSRHGTQFATIELLMKNLRFPPSGFDRFFNFESRDEITEIFKRNPKDQYLIFLGCHLTEKQNLQEIFEYGLQHIPQDFPEGGDPTIRRYFFLVSELSGLDPVVRSFAVDVQEYCNGMYENDPWYRAFKPETTYREEIKPLLK